MENVHAERSAGWSVLAYVALVIVAVVLTSPLPAPTLRASDIGFVLDTHRSSIVFTSWLMFPATGFFLWFVVGLRSYLRFAPGRQEGLPTFALAAGIVVVIFALLTACVEAAVAYAPADVFKAYSLVSIYDLFIFLQNGIAYGPVAIFAFAVAHSMRRHASAPQWLAWLGYAVAIGNGIASLSIFFYVGLMAPTGFGPQLVGALPTGVWLVLLGVQLIKHRPDAANLAAAPRS